MLLLLRFILYLATFKNGLAGLTYGLVLLVISLVAMGSSRRLSLFLSENTDVESVSDRGKDSFVFHNGLHCRFLVAILNSYIVVRLGFVRITLALQADKGLFLLPAEAFWA